MTRRKNLVGGHPVEGWSGTRRPSDLGQTEGSVVRELLQESSLRSREDDKKPWAVFLRFSFTPPMIPDSSTRTETPSLETVGTTCRVH